MTKKEAKDKRTKDILDAAIHEFVERGYEATSMESIAARAGLTKGGLYYHFESKDDILIKANNMFMEPVFAFMTDAMGRANAANGLAVYITRYLTYWTQHPRELSFIFLTMTKTISNQNLWHLYDGYTSQMIAFFEEIYRKGITAGEFRMFNVRSASIALMAALDGIIGYLVMDKNLQLEKTIDDFNETFINNYRG
ncbi:MAG TPA: TetR/AcrR family transcriptional regulator [Spirochaetota bacterium]|nr:TetR/AcrR family transcriptional regulator [Spirochaetota bacterium]HPV43375.1 TetR/AcrR family transcriptional regulator [Spirochaetota bacterium]